MERLGPGGRILLVARALGPDGAGDCLRGGTLSTSHQLATLTIFERAGIWGGADPYGRLRKALGWLAAFLIVFFAGVTVYEAGPYRTLGAEWGSPDHRTDYTVYYEAGKAVMSGAD